MQDLARYAQNEWNQISWQPGTKSAVDGPRIRLDAHPERLPENLGSNRRMSDQEKVTQRFPGNRKQKN